ncbi:unnamed protein product [Caenorhabditis bovis]|uniref:GHMP kinase N-terminal domain-containing protein n=1 Tax=Caenorhabditis bovis TaxID=2654633 RepID=A0A8S1F3S2_9PELO|nr:unnamed protein product [Caenorhabditis bovis]
MQWDVVVFSVATGIDPVNYRKEAEYFRKVGFVEFEDYVVVNDACEDVGSGGSALNAILLAAETLSAKRGYTILTKDALSSSRVLILLIGSNSALAPIDDKLVKCKNGYICNSALRTAIMNASEMGDFEGIWIMGTDSTWTLDEYHPIISNTSIVAFSFDGDERFLKDHGVYEVDKNHMVTGIRFRPGPVVLPNIILGGVILPPMIASELLTCITVYPISASTYYGVDSGAFGLKLSLIFDIVQATCEKDEQKFIENRIGSEKIENRRIEMHHTLSVRNYQYLEKNVEWRYWNKFYDDLMKKIVSIVFTDRESDDSLPKLLKSVIQLKKIFNINRNSYMKLLENEISKRPEKYTARALYTIALGLTMEANSHGGLRSGPAENPKFYSALQALRNGVGNEALSRIFTEIENNWMDEPMRMTRAARHLEAAAQIFISRRVDQFCDNYPIACTIGEHGERGVFQIQNREKPYEISNFRAACSTPSNPACLLAACLVSLGFETSYSFLKEAGFEGIRFCLDTSIPQGSGLGTSSIMAAAILKGTRRILGLADYENENEALVQMVLKVEQIMTTGGGWQDQVGALYPGLKIATVRDNRIHVEHLPLNADFCHEIHKRLMIIYTGKPRLAKNMLQEVIRNWYKGGQTRESITNLRDEMHSFKEKLSRGFMPIEEIRNYYLTKKLLTSGCEPGHVRCLIKYISRYCETCWMAGAGGGGFLYVWLTNHWKFEDVYTHVVKKFPEMTCHRITVAN